MAPSGGQQDESWRLRPYTIEQQRALKVAVIEAINAEGSNPTLADFADAAGISRRHLCRRFGRRKALYTAVTESVLRQALLLTRRGRQGRSVDGVIDALVWQRVVVYESVAPVLPAVWLRGSCSRLFAMIERSLDEETEFALRQHLPNEQTAPCAELLGELRATLALRRVDDMRIRHDLNPKDMSMRLRSEVADVFARRSADCLR